MRQPEQKQPQSQPVRIHPAEFFYPKDPDASSSRAKCARWGVEYIYAPGEEQPAPVTTTTTTTNTATLTTTTNNPV